MIAFRARVVACVVAISALISVGITAQAAQQKPAVDIEQLKAIQQRMESQYPLAKATADGTDIVTAGAVLVLQKDNLMMSDVTVSVPQSNSYDVKKGTISQGGLLGALGGELVSGLSGRNPNGAQIAHRKFLAGEKFWVTKIETHPDNVTFVVMSDPFNDMRFHASLKFSFPKGTVPTPDEIAGTVADVLKVDAPPPEVLAAAAPPPEPTKTIALGQTKDEVLSNFGPPTKIVQLGTKEIDYYPDMKVTYVKNRITDVQ